MQRRAVRDVWNMGPLPTKTTQHVSVKIGEKMTRLGWRDSCVRSAFVTARCGVRTHASTRRPDLKSGALNHSANLADLAPNKLWSMWETRRSLGNLRLLLSSQWRQGYPKYASITPDEGLEPSTLGLKVPRSTDWANRAPNWSGPTLTTRTCCLAWCETNWWVIEIELLGVILFLISSLLLEYTISSCYVIFGVKTTNKEQNACPSRGKQRAWRPTTQLMRWASIRKSERWKSQLNVSRQSWERRKSRVDESHTCMLNERFKISNANSIPYSQAVTHPSTNGTRRSLTSGSWRDRVRSTWYGRWRRWCTFERSQSTWATFKPNEKYV